MTRLAVCSLVLPLHLLLAACPETPPPVVAEGEGEAGEGEGEGADACQPIELGPVTFTFQDDVSTHYQAEVLTELDTGAPDFLVLQFFNYNERIGDLGAGTFALDDAPNQNYGGCHECLLVFADQIDELSTPGRVFFQSAGAITVEKNPREALDLVGRIAGLELVESTIGGEALESEPVPGGLCLSVGDVELDVKFVPATWTCDDDAYNAGDGVCDCDCGGVDVDCYAEAPTTSITGCAAEQICVLGACQLPCDVLAGEGCAVGAGTCGYGDPDDFCQQGIVDPAALGASCGTNFERFTCAVTGTLPAGMCDYDPDGDGVRFCKPVCGGVADCEAGQECVSLIGGVGPGAGRGYCDVPAGG